jgi:hypothetical protein
MTMPGTRLMRFARRWFPPTIVASVFEPLVADWQRQWNDATPAQRRWINAKGFVAVATTIVMMTPRLLLASGTFRTRPLVMAASFWVATSILVTLPFLKNSVPMNLLWLLLPASLTLMLPFAILPAIDAMRRDGEEPTAADRRRVLVLVFVAVCGVAIGQGWLTPAANQYYRNEMRSQRSSHPDAAYQGPRVMTTRELIAGDAATTPALYGTPRVRELNMRAAMAALPIVLAWLQWHGLTRTRKRSWRGTRSWLLAAAAALVFIAVMPAGARLEGSLPAPGFGPILGLALFAFAARMGMWWRLRAV